MASLPAPTDSSDLTDALPQGTLFQILECPVCFEVPFPPIYQCIKGHHVCKHCRARISICAVCRGKFSMTRNYAMEKIILSSNHACPYRNEGCTVTQAWDDGMENHVKICKYRPLKCPMSGDMCNCYIRNLKISNASEHLINAHNAAFYTGSHHSISHVFLSHQIDNESAKIQFAFKPNIFEVNGTHFWMTAFRLKKMIYWTVLCIGTGEESEKYLANILLGPNNVPNIHWTIQVNPISKGTEPELVQMEASASNSSIFTPSCTIEDFKKMANLSKLDNGGSFYSFVTNYTIYEKNFQFTPQSQ